jgi:hypothetical protein
VNAPNNAPSNAPNNGPTQQQKQQDCLNKINNTPDGKIYNFFSFASPWLAPDTLAWDTSRAGAVGAVGFLNAAAKNWAGTPLGTASGATVGSLTTLARDVLAPVAAAATVGQVTVHVGCYIASQF